MTEDTIFSKCTTEVSGLACYEMQSTGSLSHAVLKTVGGCSAVLRMVNFGTVVSGLACYEMQSTGSLSHAVLKTVGGCSAVLRMVNFGTVVSGLACYEMQSTGSLSHAVLKTVGGCSAVVRMVNFGLWHTGRSISQFTNLLTESKLKCHKLLKPALNTAWKTCFSDSVIC
jgi:hypothetical protein